MKVDSDTTACLHELRLCYVVILQCSSFGNTGGNPKTKNSPVIPGVWTHNLCVVILISATATGRIKRSPKRTHIKQKLDGKLAKNIQVKILLSKVQFNTSFTSLGPRKLYQIAVYSQSPLLGCWKLAAGIYFIFQMLLWQEKATFYVRLQVKSGHWPWKRNPECKFLFASHVWFCNSFIHFQQKM